MKKTYILSLVVVALAINSGCQKIKDLGKSPLEKFMSKLCHEWTVNSYNVKEYSSPQSTSQSANTLVRDTLLPRTKITFTQKEGSAEGSVVYTSVSKGITTTETQRWRYVDDIQIDLVYDYPAYNIIGLSTRYNITELTDKAFKFKRDENLVSTSNGAKYGELYTTVDMKR
jgi:hypothetical protein